MPPGTNFTRITLRDDPGPGGRSLVVKGVSPPGEANEIFVALPHDGEVVGRVDNPQIREWTATLPEGTSQFKAGNEIGVVGIAMRADPNEPIVWEQRLTIQSSA